MSTPGEPGGNPPPGGDRRGRFVGARATSPVQRPGFSRRCSVSRGWGSRIFFVSVWWGRQSVGVRVPGRQSDFWVYAAVVLTALLFVGVFLGVVAGIVWGWERC